MVFLDFYKWSSLGETLLFGLLGVQLLIINFILLKLMKLLFSQQIIESSFKHEMRFLLSTLVLFSISYLISVFRNLAIFYFLSDDDEDHYDDKLHKIWCTSNFNQSVFNIVVFFVSELIPYFVICILNYKNFSQMIKYDNFAESRRRERFMSQIGSAIFDSKDSLSSTGHKSEQDLGSVVYLARNTAEIATTPHSSTNSS